MASLRRACLWFVSASLAFALGAACDDGPSQAPELSVGYARQCEITTCSGHGTCSVSEDGLARCDCLGGYLGDSCQLCEPGFHIDFNENCTKDTRCADQPATFCGGHGDCKDDTGVVECSCATGYEGPRCNLCAATHGRNQYGECVLLTLDPDMPMTASRCTPDLCSGHGGCDDTGTKPRCICDAGYTGARCDACAEGFVRHGNVCARDNECFEGICGGHGSCDDRYGVVECACSAGFAGARCEVCAGGYGVSGGTCVPDATCGSNTCSGLGSCDDKAPSGAGPVCRCDAPATGAHCELCVAGQHPVLAGGCAANETCAPDACHGHGSCDDTTGSVRCLCATGYRGASCQECAAGYIPFDGGTCALNAQCANPVTAPGNVTFEDLAGFPDVRESCHEGLSAQDAHVSVQTAGDESLFSCAPSAIYGMESNFVYVRIEPDKPALLRFDGAVGQLGFDYAARTDLSLDVLADDILVRHLDGKARSRGTLFLSLFPAITRLTIRASGDASDLALAIDNIQYSPPLCE